MFYYKIPLFFQVTLTGRRLTYEIEHKHVLDSMQMLGQLRHRLNLRRLNRITNEKLVVRLEIERVRVH